MWGLKIKPKWYWWFKALKLAYKLVPEFVIFKTPTSNDWCFVFKAHRFDFEVGHCGSLVRALDSIMIIRLWVVLGTSFTGAHCVEPLNKTHNPHCSSPPRWKKKWVPASYLAGKVKQTRLCRRSNIPSQQKITLWSLAQMHLWPILWLFMHFSQKLQHIGDK